MPSPNYLAKTIDLLKHDTRNFQFAKSIIFQQAINQSWQKNKKNIVVQSHEKTKSIAKNLKKHNQLLLVNSPLNAQLQSDI
jgi:hypothetical protein